MKRKHIGPILFFLILAIGLVIMLLMLWALSSFKTGGSILSMLGEPPAIDIVQPAENTVIYSGQGLSVGATVYSETGLARVDFLVDGEVEQHFTPAIPGDQNAIAAFVWFGDQTGWHQLSVIAYDLQGRASAPAEVRVGVQASVGLPEIELVAAEDEGAPVGEAIPPGEDVPAGEEQPPQGDVQAPPEGGDAPLEEGDQPQGDAPAAQQPVQPEGDQAPPELPPQPQDAPPEINRFNVFVDVVVPDGGGEAVVTAVAVGSGRDDLGLQRLTLSWQSDAGNDGDFSVHCGAALACEIEMDADLGLGEWVFSLQAFDTSGQASQPAIEVIQILGEPGQPPAAAEHEIDEDWLREHLAAVQDQFDLGDVELPFGQGFDVDEFLEEMFPGRQDENEEADAAQAEDHCVSMSVEPRPDGNLVTMIIECDLQIEDDGHFLLLSIDKRLVDTGDDGITFREWYDNARTTLSAGDTFSWLDWDVTCGTPYQYNGRISAAMETDNDVSIGAILGFVEGDAVTTPDCAPGSISDVDLRTREHADGVLIAWNIAGEGDWPEDLPEDGVTFILTRFDPVSEETVELYNENIPLDLLLAGGEFEVLDDDVQCGAEYIYALAAIAADANLGLVTPGWLLRAQAPAQMLPCPADNLGAVELNLTPYWFNESIIRIRIQTFLPAGFAWPQGDAVELAILRIRQGVDRCEGPPCLGIWQVKKRIPITDEIRRNGLAYEDDDTLVVRWRETYVYRLALIVNGEEEQSSPNYSATLPPAPPPPPEISRMILSNNCPGGAPRCVIIEWQAYEQPRPNGYYAQAENIAVERIVGALDRQLFAVNIGDTTFVDLNPFVTELELMNGEVRRICHYDTTYRMVAFDAGGHTYSASPLSTVFPGCDDPWNAVIEPR